MISIGNHTEISFGRTFITHDGSTWVFREKGTVSKCGKMKIGAYSLINRCISSGEVRVEPTYYICKVEEFADKCLKNVPQYDASRLNSKFKKDAVLKIINFSSENHVSNERVKTYE